MEIVANDDLIAVSQRFAGLICINFYLNDTRKTRNCEQTKTEHTKVIARNYAQDDHEASASMRMLLNLHLITMRSSG